ncbi:unnamed protein product [Lupinus luteus]|uniref:Uncharacterized protein n=1 Tax=Lupinus luteus TaxID=3873 RepID=A0AAV1WWE8_LUPLU
MVVALIVCCVLLGGIFIFLSFVWYHRHKILRCSSSKSKGTIEAANGETLNPIDAKLYYSRMTNKKSPVAIFDFWLLEVATNCFCKSNIMGESGFRIVYRSDFDQHFKAAGRKQIVMLIENLRMK